MNDSQTDWDPVHRANFESTAFWDVHWVRKARDLYESARLTPSHFVILSADRWKTKFRGKLTRYPIARNQSQSIVTGRQSGNERNKGCNKSRDRDYSEQHIGSATERFLFGQNWRET
jgi:hypothetical protein